MAIICSHSNTLSGRYTAPHSQIHTSYKATGTIYVDYTLSNDAPDKVIIITKVMASVKMIDTADNTNYGFAKYSISSSGNTWNVNGINYNMAQGYSTTTDDGVDVKAFSDSQFTTIYKTHSGQNIAVNAGYNTTLYIKYPDVDIPITSSSIIKSGTIYVGPKTSYTVSYNANGGSGAPGAQTKWYGETLKLQTGVPTKTGWTFKGWATSSTATSATYAAGANYTANAAATLYAVWQRNTYAVTYNANGGSGAPANQTKQYGIDLTLSNNTPTFSGYTFKGWATSTANASAGTVNYAKGATYTGNTALTLYAVWELTYRKPTLSNISIERCTQSGTLDDEGDCALVSFDWTVFRSSLARYYGGDTYPYASNAIGTDGCSVTVGSYNALRNSADASGHMSVVVGSAFNSDTAYDTTISLTDSQTLVEVHTTTATGTLPTQFFPMDFNEDATTVGFFMPAPPNNDGVHFGKDVHIYIDTAAASGTDYSIYQALVKLGWTSVLE